jgi:alkaline phosphatase
MRRISSLILTLLVVLSLFGCNQLFTSKHHTAIPVRVFAVGQGSEYFASKTVDNTDIAKFLIDAIK